MSALDDRLKQHDELCKKHEYWRGPDKTCTCGRDAALIELAALREFRQYFLDMDECSDGFMFDDERHENPCREFELMRKARGL